MPHSPLRRQAGGVGLLGFLIVVVIIFVILLLGPFRRTKPGGPTQAPGEISRANTAACAMNRRTLETDVTAARAALGGRTVSMNILRKKVTIPRCPSGGVYVVSRDSTIFCTKHEPPPIELMGEILQLSEEAAEANTPVEEQGREADLLAVQQEDLPTTGGR